MSRSGVRFSSRAPAQVPWTTEHAQLWKGAITLGSGELRAGVLAEPLTWLPAVLSLLGGGYLLTTGIILVVNGNIGWGIWFGALNLAPAVLDLAVRRPMTPSYRAVFLVDVALCALAVATVAYITTLVYLVPTTAALGVAWRLSARSSGN